MEYLLVVRRQRNIPSESACTYDIAPSDVISTMALLTAKSVSKNGGYAARYVKTAGRSLECGRLFVRIQAINPYP